MEEPRGTALRVVDGGPESRWFVGFGDQHWGHPGCWKAGVRAAVEQIKERNALWVGMGNYTNCGWAGVAKFGVSEDLMGEGMVDEQFEEFTELIRPIAPQCVGLVGGKCHEGWLESRSGFMLVKHLCHDLGVPWLGLNSRFVIKVGSQKYRVHAWHGAGGAATQMGMFNTLLRMRAKSDSDLYLVGHIHQSLVYSTYFTEARGDRERQLKRLFVACGHFQEKSDYAEARGLPGGKMGLVWLNLEAERWDCTGTI